MPHRQSYVDHVLSLNVSGWAAIDGRGRQRLIITRQHQPVIKVLADSERDDLSTLSIETNAGFQHRFDQPLRDGEEVGVLFESGDHLAGSPSVYRDYPFGPVASLDSATVRAYVAAYVLAGAGLEVGALHRPLDVPSSVKVTYVDRHSREGLTHHYPELAHLPMVDPEIVDDGETLSRVANASQDFVIASHFIEHCEDPIGTIKAYCRVLRSSGVVFLVVPDRMAFFDKKRPITTIDHLIQDHELGPHLTRKSHYLEFAELVNHRSGKDLYEHAHELDSSKYSIHFHVWTAETFLEMMSAIIGRYQLPLKLVVALHSHGELIAAFRRG